MKAFEDSGGLVGLETLEYANNETLRQQADGILNTYFYKDDENGTVLYLLLFLRLVMILFTVVTHFFIINIYNI